MSEPAISYTTAWDNPEKTKLRIVVNGQQYVLKVYGDWHDEHAAKRASRAGVAMPTLHRVILLARGYSPSDSTGYLVRAHAARDSYGRWLGFSRRRDGKMQMSMSGSPSGYTFGKDAFLPPEDDRPMDLPF